MDPVTLGMAKADAAKKYAPTGRTPCIIPSGLDWASSLIPSLAINLPGQPGMPGSVSITPEAAFDLVSTARATPTNTFYVNKNTGSDSNPGTEGSPFWSMDKANVAATAASGTSRVYVAAGVYARNQMPCYQAYLTKDIAWIATGGRVVCGAFDTFTAPTLDATYTNCYSWALTNVGRVVDLVGHTRYGTHVEFLNVPTAAACNITPNSWALVSGTLYVNRADRAAVTTANTRVYRSSGNAPLYASSPVNVYLGGQNPGDGFDFEGAPNEVVGLVMGSASTTAKVVAARDCTFSFAGAVGTTARVIHIDALPGLVYMHGCRFDAGMSDGLNLRNSKASGRTYVLTVNCSGYDNGRPSSSASSCNGWTTHDDVYGIDVCGDYWGNHGGSVASVNTAKALIAGTRIRDDYGDLVLSSTGTLPPTAVYVRDTAEFWCDRVVADMPAGTQAFASLTAGTSKIHRRDCPPSRGMLVATGTNDTY
jgi:hypothetical protein